MTSNGISLLSIFGAGFWATTGWVLAAVCSVIIPSCMLFERVMYYGQ